MQTDSSVAVGGLNIDREIKLHREATKFGSPKKGQSELDRAMSAVRHTKAAEPVRSVRSRTCVVPNVLSAAQESELARRLREQQSKEAAVQEKQAKTPSELEQALARRAK